MNSNPKASRNVHKKIDVYDQNDVFMASIKDERDQDDPNFVKTHCTEYVAKVIINDHI